MKRIETLFKYILLIGLSLLLFGCQTAQETPVPAPTIAPIQEEVTVQPNESTLPDDCKYEDRTENGLYQYHSTCGGGIYVIYSYATFRGHPDDPGTTLYYVSAQHASVWWQTKSDNTTWISLFGTESEARDAICNAVMGRIEGPKRTITQDSAWILGGNACK